MILPYTRLSSWPRHWWVITSLMSAFLIILIPTYLEHYGPTNFFYFCDTALLLCAYSLWTKRPLAASMALVGIFLPQVLWSVDLVVRLFGVSLVGMTNYMYDQHIWWPIRALSLFHLWLPMLLWWVVHQLGCDRRAWIAWCLLGIPVLVICWVALPPPPAHGSAPVNVNLIYGFSDDAPQHWMPEWAWFMTMLIGLPLVVWWPTHRLLLWVMPPVKPHRPA